MIASDLVVTFQICLKLAHIVMAESVRGINRSMYYLAGRVFRFNSQRQSSTLLHIGNGISDCYSLVGFCQLW
jgi:hypothetical protein